MQDFSELALVHNVLALTFLNQRNRLRHLYTHCSSHDSTSLNSVSNKSTKTIKCINCYSSPLTCIHRLIFSKTWTWWPWRKSGTRGNYWTCGTSRTARNKGRNWCSGSSRTKRGAWGCATWSDISQEQERVRMEKLEWKQRQRSDQGDWFLQNVQNIYFIPDNNTQLCPANLSSMN